MKLDTTPVQRREIEPPTMDATTILCRVPLEPTRHNSKHPPLVARSSNQSTYMHIFNVQLILPRPAHKPVHLCPYRSEPRHRRPFYRRRDFSLQTLKSSYLMIVHDQTH